MDIAVTTNGHLAVVQAGVVHVPVAVIAGLVTLPDDAVTTTGYLAVKSACIRVHKVAIIAGKA